MLLNHTLELEMFLEFIKLFIFYKCGWGDMRDEILNLKPQLVAEGNLEASHIIPNSVFIKCYSLNAYEYFSFSPSEWIV